ncbi:hypothetical protein ACQ4WX_47690 [Streptomyces lasalocidi]
MSSLGDLFSPVVFDDVDYRFHYRFRTYDACTAYGQPKTANALVPGTIGDTSLARHMDMREVAGFVASGAVALPPRKTVEQGAATSVLPAGLADGGGHHRPPPGCGPCRRISPADRTGHGPWGITGSSRRGTR